MGCCSSKDDAEDAVINFENIYYDEHGTLRSGRLNVKDKASKEEELRAILNIEEGENQDDEEVKWYIMDAAWIASWFAYVHYESDTSPNPGPCRNDRLLKPDLEEEKWKPQPKLIMASKKRDGDYRRVSRKTWELYCNLYPGSGPTITTTFKRDDNYVQTGLYDTQGWEIQDFRFPDHLRKDPNHAGQRQHNDIDDPGDSRLNHSVERSELMEESDKGLSKSLAVQMDFLGTRRIVDEDAKKKSKKRT
jgi:hypothetical protein